MSKSLIWLLAALLIFSSSAHSAGWTPSDSPAVLNALSGPTPAGANVVGRVGIDQTTPGTSNAVQDVDALVPLSGTCNASCNGTTLIGPIDTLGYRSITLQNITIGVGGNLVLQGSNDPVCLTAVNWLSGIPMYANNAAIGSVQITDFNFLGSVYSQVSMRCLRIQFISYTSGTYTMEGYLRASPGPFSPMGQISLAPTPGGGTQVTASATGTTGAVTASLPALSGKSNYLCGFTVTSAGTTTPALFPVTITGTTSGTLTFEYWATGAAQGALERTFTPCIVSSGSNTAITVNVPALGTGTAGVAVTANGFQL